MRTNGRRSLRKNLVPGVVSVTVRRLWRVAVWTGLVTAVTLSVTMPSAASTLRDDLRLALFARINEVRAGHGLAPLNKDPLAFRVAQQHSLRQIFDGTFGHFATDGLAPYHRYSFAGGNDGLLENTASWSSDSPYDDAEIAGLMERSLQAMLDETPPDDGHRRAILDPWATHLGTGIAWKGGEVRITQEFLRRYIEWSALPTREAAPGDRVLVEGRPVSGWSVGAASVHYEPFPKSMRPTKANSIVDWDLPDDRVDFEPKKLDRASDIVRLTHVNGGQPGDLFVRDDGSFSFAVPFDRGPGIYTLVVWVRQDGNGSELIAASNISIRSGEEPR
jgi:uncharacterized protein YkwD